MAGLVWRSARVPILPAHEAAKGAELHGRAEGVPVVNFWDTTLAAVDFGIFL